MRLRYGHAHAAADEQCSQIILQVVSKDAFPAFVTSVWVNGAAKTREDFNVNLGCPK